MEFDKVILLKNKIFVGKGYCTEGMFKLNINEVNVSVYVIDSCDLWHSRLAHLNYKSIEYMHKHNYINLSNKNLKKNVKFTYNPKLLRNRFLKLKETYIY